MSIGDIAVYAVAALALGALALVALNKLAAFAQNWRQTVDDLKWTGLVLAQGALALGGVLAVLVMAVLAYVWITDQRVMHQCTTLHERQEKAAAAPDDYFGRELRKTVADETKSCAEFAARKEARSN
jgi:hypothetical protein